MLHQIERGRDYKPSSGFERGATPRYDDGIPERDRKPPRPERSPSLAATFDRIHAEVVERVKARRQKRAAEGWGNVEPVGPNEQFVFPWLGLAAGRSKKSTGPMRRPKPEPKAYMSLPADIPADFATQVDGDCMAPDWPDGAIVAFAHIPLAAPPVPTACCVLFVDGTWTFKRVEADPHLPGRIILQAMNPAPHHSGRWSYPLDDVTQLSRAVAVVDQYANTVKGGSHAK